MVFYNWARTAILVMASWAAVANAQDEFFEYLEEPNMLWTGATTDSTTEGSGVREGNGVFMSPDGQLLVSTSFDATLRAFDPMTGAVKWTYTPNSLGFPIACLSGVTFNYEGIRPYLIYAIADAATDLVDNPIAET